MGIQYDFTESQRKAVSIYLFFPLNPHPTDEDFETVFRIVKKHFDFHSFTSTFQDVLHLFLVQMYELVLNNDLNLSLRIMNKFEICEIILKFSEIYLLD
jgi:hypothetical protein